jgi:hypothetical protein
MRNTLLFLGLAVGFGFACGADAGAVPVGTAAMKEAVVAASPLQEVQYAEWRARRGGIVKCYREFVVGPYRCHWYPL